MPVVFKVENTKPFVIEKNGSDGGEPTRFYFRSTRGKQMESALSAMLTQSDLPYALREQFKRALIRWENLVDEKGNEVEFSVAARDWLVEESGIFTINDVYDVLFCKSFDDMAAEHGKKKSTSKSVSGKR